MNRLFHASLKLWNAWWQQSVNRRIFAAMVTVGGFTVLVKLFSAAKEIAIAYQFGTGDELDAFLIAFLLPAFIINLIGGSLNAALIPIYIQVRKEEGQKAVQDLYSSVMIVMAACLTAATIIQVLAAPYTLPLMAAGFAPEKLALAESLYYLLLVVVIVNGVSVVWGAILNAYDRFALAAAVPMVTSALTVILVIMMAKRWGIYSVAIATAGGAIIEAGLLGWSLMRAGISVIPRWHGMSPWVMQVFKQYMPMMTGAFLMGSAGLVSQSMAATLGSGSVSALAYGGKVTSLLVGVGAVAVSTAVLPHFSHMVAMADWNGLRSTISSYGRLLLIASLPVTVALIYFSEPVVAALFQRGAFTEDDVHLVGRVQVMYLLHIPLYTVGMLFVRLISSAQANHILMWGSAINLVTNVVLTWFFMKWLNVVGVALATSTMYLISVVFLAAVSLRLLRTMTAASGKAKTMATLTQTV